MKQALGMPLRASDPDAPLVRRFQAGDQGAFQELYERYKTKVYNTAYRITCNATEAADVTQEVFIHLFKKMGLFEFRSSFSTWVYRMSVNASIDRYRKITRHPAYSTDDEVFQESSQYRKLADEKRPAADQEASQKETEAHVQQMIASLPVKLRTAVVLRYLQDLSYQEVAQALRCSEGTVKSRLNRAHEKLRKLLSIKTKEGDGHVLQQAPSVSARKN